VSGALFIIIKELFQIKFKHLSQDNGGTAMMENTNLMYLPVEKLAPNLYAYESGGYSCTLDFRASRRLGDTGFDMARGLFIFREELPVLESGDIEGSGPVRSVCDDVIKGRKVLLEFDVYGRDIADLQIILEREIRLDNFQSLAGNNYKSILSN